MASITVKSPITTIPSARGEQSVPQLHVDYPGVSYDEQSSGVYLVKASQSDYDSLIVDPDYEVLSQ